MSFTDNGDGTVTDNVTGLMWQQEDDDVRMDWYEAIDYCEALELAGHTDWRLPDEYEIQGIVDYGRIDPAIDTTYFPGTNSSYYWSSSIRACSHCDPQAWGVYFDYGGWRVDFHEGYVQGHIMPQYTDSTRCVR